MPPSVPDISPAAVIDLLHEQQIVDPSEPLTPESDLFAAGLDSLALMQLLHHAEQRFRVRLPAAAMTKEKFATVSALAAFLSAQPRTVAA